METLQIPLSESLKTFLEKQATKKGFSSSSDYVQSLLGELQEREQDRKELEEKLLEGVRSPKVPGDEAFWRARRQKIYDQHPELDPCKQNTQRTP
ncbi:MAG: type II toxin-antitoxin system ParD family antitoxin [Planctomycetes bacterium]|nr:type II toxin-antitoxin system ParD family antitoxin [Planctomycetota bacterium]